ncbi:hypothetical protein VINI7043_26615 [Vibrio nigripulchritudo ATCC 27043]|uniref:hypothetical protein n=1 Tax=Vibrio nigripulchritudo TaxID=28173 RepID=UPI00021C2A8F|nr:hypothetical protein [Vibrio nigripulchritudo]EGU55370.1 hypothetical protein VINI7043_26615 [Vibrio nigripulchritudo ATCC 27043]BCL72178.1 hypothetical protein VNTUMSATTG_41150 [Vibrio nigripulchritudo]BDU33536.1 hypothetical protein TUMSATVNIG1_41450 [Vibrio nigripulchritudo]
MKRVFIIVFGLLFSLNSFAAAGWSGKATITGIYALDGDKVLIKLSSFNNPGGCAVNSSGDVMINSTTHKNWFSMALSAYAASKPVDFYVVDSCTKVWANTSYANVGHMRLR